MTFQVRQTLQTNNTSSLLLGLLLAGAGAAAPASEQQELLQLKNTVVNLVDALVQQGVLDKKQAAALIKKAEDDAVRQAAGQIASAPAEAAPTPAEASNVGQNAAGKQVVRVPYVPQFVKDEIRNQLRSEMRQDILADVADKARKERWGTPDALPAWVNSVKLYGDVRVRNQYDYYGEENPATLGGQNLYLNILSINKAGNLAKAGTKAFLNTSEDQNRWRERVRLGLTAKIADHWQLDTRLSTGNAENPVSANLTLGNTGQRFTVQLDRAQLRYDRPDSTGFNWLTLQGGRISNPWFSTDLVWDEDLGFDGVAAVYRRRLQFGDEGLASTNLDRTFSFTGGAFPLQQPEFQSQDRWLVAGQLGAHWEFDNQNLFKAGVAFYDYMHMPGKRNALQSTVNDGTAPQYLQKGNLLFNISNGNPGDLLFALASDYRLLDVTFSLDLANLAPYHVVLTTDIVKNLGFDKEEINQRTGGVTYLYPIGDRTLGALIGATVGWPDVTRSGAWQVSFDYRYLQRDAVLDAFTESDFHLGGTDTQGYRITGAYGLANNVWLRGRWISSTEIDGPPLAINTLQFDLNAKF